MVILKSIIRSISHLLFRSFLCLFIEKQASIRNNKRVLIQINSGIGDSILALPLIHQLTLNGFEVHTIVNKDTAIIMNLCPEVEEFYVIDYRIIYILRVMKQINNLNKKKFRYFIGALPSNLIRDALLPIILRIPIRTKHFSPHKEKYRNYDFLFNRLTMVNNDNSNVVSNLMLFSLISRKLKADEIGFKILLPKNLTAEMRKKLRKLGFSEKKITLGIHPGCKESWAFKRWPAENFTKLIKMLALNEDIQILLFGGPDEIGLGERITHNCTADALSLIGKLSLEETIAAISLCKLFISNDSGLMHIATLFDIPVVGLFGGKSSDVLTGPYGRSHVVIKKCDIREISTSEVFKETEKLLDRLDKNSI